jgi:hypothetical protein
VQLSQDQVNLCDQMKVTVERYFNSLNDLLDETNGVLTDWSSSKTDLVSSCMERIYQQGLSVEKNNLTQCLIL